MALNIATSTKVPLVIIHGKLYQILIDILKACLDLIYAMYSLSLNSL